MESEKKHPMPCIQSELRASDEGMAFFLRSFLKFTRNNGLFINVIEFADLDNYKMVTDMKKKKQVIAKIGKRPFLFVLHKN